MTDTLFVLALVVPPVVVLAVPVEISIQSASGSVVTSGGRPAPSRPGLGYTLSVFV